jgi:hypothetical protein
VQSASRCEPVDGKQHPLRNVRCTKPHHLRSRKWLHPALPLPRERRCLRHGRCCGLAHPPTRRVPTWAVSPVNREPSMESASVWSQREYGVSVSMESVLSVHPPSPVHSRLRREWTTPNRVAKRETTPQRAQFIRRTRPVFYAIPFDQSHHVSFDLALPGVPVMVPKHSLPCDMKTPCAPWLLVLFGFWRMLARLPVQ